MKTWLVQLATQTIAQALSLRTATVLGLQYKCFMCTSLIMKNMKKTPAQGLLFNKVNRFYCFFNDIVKWNQISFYNDYMGIEEYSTA